MQYKISIAVMVVGVVLVALAAILGWAVVPKVIDNKIKDQTQLKPDSETWEKWADIPYPIYLIFYVFHVTNPDQVEQGEKPIFEEKGPYVYDQKRTKEELKQEEEIDPEYTVQYKERKTYFFNAKESEGTEDDVVNVINIAFVAVVHGIATKLELIAPPIANGPLWKGNERLIRRNVKVRELLFEGFDVRVYSDNMFLGPMLPEEFDGGLFGLYKGENGSDSKEYNIYTGVESHEEFGLIKTYDGKPTLGFWEARSECDKVKGSDGSLYAPFVKKDREIDVFSTDLCRSLKFTYAEESEVKGIKAYRFTVPRWTLEDPRINKENLCYCMINEDKGQVKPDDCPKAGAMSLETCRNGAPIMMSTPYFLDGDEGYWKASNLPEADPEKHLTYLDIEPHSGVLLRGHKRIQVNVDLKLVRNIKAYENLTEDIVFPLVWADEYAEMDRENIDDLKGKLIKPLKAVDIAKWTVLGVGIAIFIAGVLIFTVQRRRSKETV